MSFLVRVIELLALKSDEVVNQTRGPMPIAHKPYHYTTSDYLLNALHK